jgi:hypothetical protein
MIQKADTPKADVYMYLDRLPGNIFAKSKPSHNLAYSSLETLPNHESESCQLLAKSIANIFFMFLPLRDAVTLNFAKSRLSPVFALIFC